MQKRVVASQPVSLNVLKALKRCRNISAEIDCAAFHAIVCLLDSAGIGKESARTQAGNEQTTVFYTYLPAGELLAGEAGEKSSQAVFGDPKSQPWNGEKVNKKVLCLIKPFQIQNATQLEERHYTLLA